MCREEAEDRGEESTVAHGLQRLRTRVRNPQWLMGYCHSLHAVSVWWSLELLGLVLFTAHLKHLYVLSSGQRGIAAFLDF